MSERHPIRDANDGIEHALHLDARRKLRIVAIIDLVKGSAAVAAGMGLLRANAHALENGGAAVGMHVRLLGADRVLDRIKTLKGEPKVLRARLSADAEDALHDMQAQIPDQVLDQGGGQLF